MLQQSGARPPRLRVPLLLLTAILLTGALISSYASHTSFARAVRSIPVPFHAPRVLHTCRALAHTPAPPHSFYQRTQSDRFQPGTHPVLIRNATLWTGRLDAREAFPGDVLLDQGIIKSLGSVDPADIPHDVLIVEANGAWVTPGIVDAHSHLAVEPAPALSATSDGNSFQGPILPWLRSLDGLNTHDDAFHHSIAGGVTTSLILPGSANAIGGQAFVIKLRPTTERSPSSMLLEPPFSYNRSGIEYDETLRWRHMKHACGENPARVYSATRMDTQWAFRQAYDKARQIKNAQDEYCAKALAGDWAALAGKPFPEELQWEALVDVLRGRVKVQTHCYEAVDFDDFIRLSNEFEFPVAAFHHAHEAYLVPDLLKKAYGHTPAIAMFATFSRYKREAFRHSEYAPRILADNDIPVIMKSDHPAIVSRYLLHEAAQAHYYGLPEHLALASVISTPATILGLDHRIGFLKAGYDADVVIWDSHPLALGAAPTQVFIDGIPQLPEVYTAPKPASAQHAPHTPDFDAEAARTLAHDGLPPLAARSSTAGVVVFTNVSSMWVKDRDGRGVTDLLAPADSDTTAVRTHAVVVRNGEVVCTGVEAACLRHVDASDAVRVDLRGGALQPGLVSFGASLGLQEISMELSTTDGTAFDPLLADVPAIAGGAGYLPRAVDGLQYGTRDALLAYHHGVTIGVTAPIHSAFFGGLSAAFSLGATHKLEKGAVVQDVAAVHVSLARGSVPSVSTQIAVLRRLLLHPQGESGKWFAQAAYGKIPLVIDVDSADIMASLLLLKQEVEEETGSTLKVTFSGATEAHLLAKEIANAHVGVILTPPRSFPYTWDRKRILPGAPLTAYSAVAELVRHGVKVGLGPQGISGAPAMSTWAVRNLRFDAAWAALEAPDVLDKASAFTLVSTNVEELLGLDVKPGKSDLVATAGGDLLGYEGKVVAVISPRREVVDIL